MVMDTLQIRLPKGIIEQIDKVIDAGNYSSRSDVIRDAVRKMIITNQVGTIPNTGNSVDEVRLTRKKLSKEKFDLEKINKLGN